MIREVPVSERYGIRTFSHGGQYVLTVMTADGAAQLIDVLTQYDGLDRVVDTGQPLRFRERTDGAIDALVARYAIRMVGHEAWRDLRAHLGDRAVFV